MYFHADNCTGQNKNSYVLWYLLWRIITGRHNNILLSFLVVGHTKFAPDWCFGLFKRLFKRTKIGSLKTIVEVAESSAKCNHAQLVVDEEGRVIVPIYDWAIATLLQSLKCCLILNRVTIFGFLVRIQVILPTIVTFVFNFVCL